MLTCHSEHGGIPDLKDVVPEEVIALSVRRRRV